MPSPPKNETQEQREKRLKRQRDYEARKRAADPDAFKKKQREAVRRYTLKNPDKVKVCTKRWQTKSKDHINKKRREWRAKNTIPFLLYEAKSRAKKTGIEFSIELHDIPPMGNVCPLFGVPFSTPEQGRTPFSPSLDRIDSSKGYVKGNVWIVGFRANCIKNDGTAEEHEKIAHAMRCAYVS